jgi:hypothetical protein
MRLRVGERIAKRVTSEGGGAARRPTNRTTNGLAGAHPRRCPPSQVPTLAGARASPCAPAVPPKSPAPGRGLREGHARAGQSRNEPRNEQSPAPAAGSEGHARAGPSRNEPRNERAMNKSPAPAAGSEGHARAGQSRNEPRNERAMNKSPALAAELREGRCGRAESLTQAAAKPRLKCRGRWP